jgi:SAM-dependent methyltransferase
MAKKYTETVDPNAPNHGHAFMLDLVGCNRRVLELGAAAGHVTRALVDRGCVVTAIECDGEAAVQLKGVADEVFVGDLNNAAIFDDVPPYFDVVLAGDVLEHLLAPQEVLNRAVRLLKPGGSVVLSIPNVAHADVRLALLLGTWDYREWGLLDEGHVRFFTLKTTRELIRGAGLVISELRRVRVPVFGSELAIDRDAIPAPVLDVVLADPESETYQFVLSAAVDNGDIRLNLLSDDVGRLREQVQQFTVEKGRLNAEIGELRRQLENAEIARKQSSEQLDALVRTKTFRYTRRARHWYGRMHHQ